MTTTTDPRSIALADIAESPNNPRRSMSADELASLAASIKQHGVMQPLLLRPNPAGGSPAYELVFGHRRLRAAIIAGLAEVPCLVRSLDDITVACMQLVENLQREELNALEEAEGFGRLRDEGGLTAVQIAERVGKKPGVVHARLKLLELAPEVRQALEAGQIQTEIALLIARIPLEKLQLRALALCREQGADSRGRQGYRTLRDAIVDKMTLDLKQSIFDPKDAALLPSAGACSACHKRTGGEPDLFADVIKPDSSYYYAKKGVDLCTDPDCHEAKRKAHLAAEAAKLEAKGKTVLNGNAARAALSAHGEVKGAYIALKDVKDDLAKVKTKAPGKPMPAMVTILDQRTGKAVQAVKREDAKAAGVKLESSERGGPDRSYAAREAKAKLEREKCEKAAAREKQIRLQMFSALRAAYTASPRRPDDLRVIAAVLLERLDYRAAVHLDALYDTGKRRDDREQLPQTLPYEQLAVLLIDAALVHELVVNSYGDAPPQTWLNIIGNAYGVDLKALRAQAEAELDGSANGAAPAAAAKSAPKKAAKKAAKKAPAKPKAKKTGTGERAAAEAAAPVDEPTADEVA